MLQWQIDSFIYFMVALCVDARQKGKLACVEELGYGQYPVQLSGRYVSSRNSKEPFHPCKGAQATTNFSEQKRTFTLRLQQVGLRERHAAVKDLLTDKHKLYSVTFADSTEGRQWYKVIFCDEYVFILTNENPTLFCRPSGEVLTYSDVENWATTKENKIRLSRQTNLWPVLSDECRK